MIKDNVKSIEGAKKGSSIHELILDMISNSFDDKENALRLKIKKGDVELCNEYKSEVFFLCKFCGSTFGINKRGKMPPLVKFTVDSENYHVDFQMNEGKKEVIFKEKINENNFISLEVFKR